MRGAAAGALAAGVWAAVEPALARAYGTPMTDVRLLGRSVTRGRLWPVVGVAMHVGNGAAFGWVFERCGLGGSRQGIVAAEAENLLLWPGMAVVDRLHPDRRSGNWPKLLTSGRTFALEATTHSLFGALLGALVKAGDEE
jgi:hypothetical protein